MHLFLIQHCFVVLTWPMLKFVRSKLFGRKPSEILTAATKKRYVLQSCTLFLTHKAAHENYPAASFFPTLRHRKCHRLSGHFKLKGEPKQRLVVEADVTGIYLNWPCLTKPSTRVFSNQFTWRNRNDTVSFSSIFCNESE